MGGMNYYLYGRGDPKDVRLSLSGRGTCAPFLMFFTSVFWGLLFPQVTLNRTPSEGWYDGGQAIECIVFLGEDTKLWKSDIVLYIFRDTIEAFFGDNIQVEGESAANSTVGILWRIL